MEENNGFSEYNRLILRELERMNSNYESLRRDFDSRLQEINDRMSSVQNTEKAVNELKAWQEKVNDVWSPSLMKESKDEIYKQKGRWTATIAIITFFQILIGLILALKDKLF